MLEFKICPKCKNSTAIENEVCPNCGNDFKRENSTQNHQLPQELAGIEIKPLHEKRAGPDKFFIAIILFLFVIAFLIVIPTKKVTKDIEVPYLDTEMYTDQEPYTAMQITNVQETWQETHTSTDRATSPEGYYYKSCGAGCTCFHYTSDPDTIPSYYCDECSCPTSGVYEQSRTVPKYKWVTKYRDVTKTRNITKIRIEPRPVEINWIIGFNTPWEFHLL